MAPFSVPSMWYVSQPTSSGATIRSATAPPAASTLGLPVTVQLIAADTCYGATFATAAVNVPDRFRAKNGQ